MVVQLKQNKTEKNTAVLSPSPSLLLKKKKLNRVQVSFLNNFGNLWILKCKLGKSLNHMEDQFLDF